MIKLIKINEYKRCLDINGRRVVLTDLKKRNRKIARVKRSVFLIQMVCVTVILLGFLLIAGVMGNLELLKDVSAGNNVIIAGLGVVMMLFGAFLLNKVESNKEIWTI